MRVYVAGKWEEKERIREVMNRLHNEGHFITFDWTRNDDGFTPRQAWLDMNGVLTADALVLVVEKDLPYSGSLTEMGMMLAKGGTVYVLGNAVDTNIFTKLPQVRRDWPRPARHIPIVPADYS